MRCVGLSRFVGGKQPGPRVEFPRKEDGAMIQSVMSAISLIQCFSEDSPILGITELSRRTQMHKSTVHHLVTTLTASGFLERTAQGQYKLGMELFTMGSLVVECSEIATVAGPILQNIERRTRGTAHVAVLDGMEAVYAKKVDSSQSGCLFSRIGKRVPLHCTGTGKLLLAHHPDLLPRLIATKGLAAYTPNTITDPQRLEEELQTVRVQGFAIDHEETRTGLVSVATPLRDLSGEVVAALTVAGPACLFRPAPLKAVIHTMIEAARQASEEMGYRPARNIPSRTRMAPPVRLLQQK